MLFYAIMDRAEASFLLRCSFLLRNHFIGGIQMKNLFRIDSPFVQKMSLVFDLMLINILWLIGVILISWGMAFFEYSLQIPGNRIGFQGNGGPFTLVQLKVIQEVITLIIFAIFTMIFFQGETLKWNHLAAGVCLVMAVYFVFMK